MPEQLHRAAVFSSSLLSLDDEDGGPGWCYCYALGSSLDPDKELGGDGSGKRQACFKSPFFSSSSFPLCDVQTFP